MESAIYSLLVSAVVGLTWVAYKHPVAFRRDWYILLENIFAVVFFIMIFGSICSLFMGLFQVIESLNWLKPSLALKTDTTSALASLEAFARTGLKHFYWCVTGMVMSLGALGYLCLLSRLQELTRETGPEPN